MDTHATNTPKPPRYVLHRPRWHARFYIRNTHLYPVLSAHAAAQRLQAWTRGRAQRRGYRRRAIGIDAGGVPGHVRMEARYAQFLRRHGVAPSAATFLVFTVARLQAWVRMVAQVKRYRYRRRVAALGDRAARSIQKAFRGWRGGRRPLTLQARIVMIQRAWRAFSDKRTFRYFRKLLAFRNAGDARTMLKSICPAETALLDPAVRARVRFRLGGTSWPPQIFYRIFISGPLCDVNAFAPRNYASKSVLAVDTRSGDASPAIKHLGVRVGTRVYGATLGATHQARADASRGIRGPDGPLSAPTRSSLLGSAGRTILSTKPLNPLENTAETVVLLGASARQLETSRMPKLSTMGPRAAAPTQPAKRGGYTPSPSAALGVTVDRLDAADLLGGCIPPADAADPKLPRSKKKHRSHAGQESVPVPTVGAFAPGYTRVADALTGGGLVLQSADEVVPGDWYHRDEVALNDWRLVSVNTVEDADKDPVVRMRKELAARYKSPAASDAPSAATLARRAKRSRRRWLMSLYSSGIAGEKSAVVSTGNTSEHTSVVLEPLPRDIVPPPASQPPRSIHADLAEHTTSVFRALPSPTQLARSDRLLSPERLAAPIHWYTDRPGSPVVAQATAMSTPFITQLESKEDPVAVLSAAMRVHSLLTGEHAAGLATQLDDDVPPGDAAGAVDNDDETLSTVVSTDLVPVWRRPVELGDDEERELLAEPLGVTFMREQAQRRATHGWHVQAVPPPSMSLTHPVTMDFDAYVASWRQLGTSAPHNSPGRTGRASPTNGRKKSRSRSRSKHRARAR